MLMAATVSAGGNGIQTFEFVLPVSGYVECLDEFVSGEYNVTVRYHLVETPSGSVHFLDNWRSLGVFEGLSSGTVWIGKAISPFHDNMLTKGRNVGYVDNALLKPVDGGQMWRVNNNFKIKLDENGVPTMTINMGREKCLGERK